jgi:integrase
MGNRKRRGRGEGSIFQREDGIWVGSVSLGQDANGKRRRKTVYGSTKQEVQAKLYEVLQKKIAGTEPSSMSLKSFLDFWLAGLKVKLADATFQRYDEIVKAYLVPCLGGVVVAKLTPFHVTQLYQRMEEEGHSVDARHKAGAKLRQALKVAVRFRMIASSPAEQVPLPKVERDEIRPFNPDQARVFLRAALSGRLFPLFLTALDSGCRQGELFALEWSDIDFERGEVSVTKSLQERLGKFKVKDVKTKAGRRRVPLTPQTLDALRRHRELMGEEGHGSKLVFCDTDGGFLRKSNVTRRHLKPTLRRANEMLAGEAAGAGRPFTPLPDARFHDLRHSCATLLLLDGNFIKAVSERLGHADIETTLATYSHVLPVQQERLVASMGRIIGPLEDGRRRARPRVRKGCGRIGYS